MPARRRALAHTGRPALRAGAPLSSSVTAPRIALNRAHQTNEAIRQFREAIRLKPGFTAAKQSLRAALTLSPKDGARRSVRIRSSRPRLPALRSSQWRRESPLNVDLHLNWAWPCCHELEPRTLSVQSWRRPALRAPPRITALAKRCSWNRRSAPRRRFRKSQSRLWCRVSWWTR